MLYTDDSWTYNRQMYKTYERECLRDKRLRVIDTFQLDLFLPVAYRVQRTQQTWPVSQPPFHPSPLLLLLAVFSLLFMLRVMCIFLRFDFDSVLA